ncbi:MAG TPA: carbohydrate ABC transporter permease [Ruminiclostridium sp.]
MKANVAELLYQRIIKLSIILFSGMCLYPLFYILVLSFTKEREWVEKNGIVLLPADPTFNAYITIITKSPLFFNAFFISVLRVVIGSTLIVAFTLVMGYVTSRKGLPGKKIMLIMVLVTILFPGGLIPTYLVIKELGLMNKFPVYFIPSLVDGFGVLVFKQFFSNIPAEIEESAQMDGVSEFSMLIKIIIPMSTAVIATWVLFTAVGQWNSWFDALVYIRNSKLMPLQLIIYNLFQESLGFSFNQSILNPVSRVSSLTLKMATTVLGIIPILCIYPFLQKYFVTGVYTGSVKG